jgi:hypothetical protein
MPNRREEMQQFKLTPTYYLKRMVKSDNPTDWVKNYIASFDCANKIASHKFIDGSTKVTNFLVDVSNIGERVGTEVLDILLKK